MNTVATLAMSAFLTAAQTALPLRNLESPDVNVRARAMVAIDTAIKSDPALLDRDDVAVALVRELDRENAFIDDRYRRGISSEGVVEHYDVLLIPLCLELLQLRPNESGLLSALVRGIYNPDSPMAAQLAARGAPVVNLAIQLTSDRSVVKRWNGYALLGQLIAFQREGRVAEGVDAVGLRRAREALRAGLGDPSASGRREAILAIVVARDKEAVPLLRQLADHDPDTGRGPDDPFSVRAMAAKAAEQLK